MINAYMTQKEILQEFWKGYHEDIKPRCFKVAERYKKQLLPLQKKRGEDSWLRMKQLYTIVSKNNRYSVLLWVRYMKNGNIIIKTTVWCTFMDNQGRKKILLLPAEERVNSVIIFTSGFFSEWKSQLGIEGTEVEVQAEFFKWVEGNYKVYHHTNDNTGEKDGRVEVDLNNLGAGLGTFKDPGSYMFKHFLGDTKIEEMQSKVGYDIQDPLELWDAFYKKSEITILSEEIDPEFDYFEEERKKALDEIYELYG